jgi:uncharacterized protein (TIGR03083 family)
MIELPLHSSVYLDALSGESERLAASARRIGLEPSVPSCPGWDIAKLVLHVGILHRWVTSMVETGATDRLDVKSVERAPDGAERIEWFEAGGTELVRVLGEAGPDRMVWTLAGPGRSGFWFRRMAHETLVHRLDIELSAGPFGSVSPVLAADGVDEYLFGHLARHLARQPIEGPTTIVRLEPVDVDTTWNISIDRDAITNIETANSADATVSASSTKLLTFLWNRGSLCENEIRGDRNVINTWHKKFQF